MIDTTKLSVEEIRNILVSDYGISREEVDSIKQKKNLAYRLYQAQTESDSKIEKPNFEEIEIDSSNLNISDAIDIDGNKIDCSTESIPEMGTLEWEGYILSKLNDNEKEVKDGNTYPKANGLRRMCEKYLGEIMSCGPKQVLVSNDDSGRTTVVYEVSLVTHSDRERKIFSEVADCSQFNTPAPYNLHPAATASTKAEGRVFRKLLGITTCTAEEIGNTQPVKRTRTKFVADTEDDDCPAGLNQINIINSLSKRLDIDVDKFISKYVQGKKIDSLTRAEAVILITKLGCFTAIDSTNEKIPEEIQNK